MDLYLIRHGIAAERGTYPNDDDRPLVEKGIRRSRSVAQRIYRLGLQFDLLLSSPLVRAQQTAEILCQESLASSFQVIPGLAPGCELKAALEQTKQSWIAAPPENAAKQETITSSSKSSKQAIAWVGHQPELSSWAETLIWEPAVASPTNLGHEAIILKKAGIIGLHLPADWQHQPPWGQAELFWVTPPRLLL